MLYLIGDCEAKNPEKRPQDFIEVIEKLNKIADETCPSKEVNTRKENISECFESLKEKHPPKLGDRGNVYKLVFFVSLKGSLFGGLTFFIISFLTDKAVAGQLIFVGIFIGWLLGAIIGVNRAQKRIEEINKRNEKKHLPKLNDKVALNKVDSLASLKGLLLGGLTGFIVSFLTDKAAAETFTFVGLFIGWLLGEIIGLDKTKRRIKKVNINKIVFFVSLKGSLFGGLIGVIIVFLIDKKANEPLVLVGLLVGLFIGWLLGAIIGVNKAQRMVMKTVENL